MSARKSADRAFVGAIIAFNEGMIFKLHYFGYNNSIIVDFIILFLLLINFIFGKE